MLPGCVSFCVSGTKKPIGPILLPWRYHTPIVRFPVLSHYFQNAGCAGFSLSGSHMTSILVYHHTFPFNTRDKYLMITCCWFPYYTQIVFKRYFHGNFTTDGGTLWHLRCLIRWRNISKDVSKEMNKWEDFFHSLAKARDGSRNALLWHEKEDKQTNPTSVVIFTHIDNICRVPLEVSL